MDSVDSTPQLGEKPVLENNENARSLMAQSDKKAADYAANALDSTQAVFNGSGIQHSGQGHFNVQGNVNITSNPPQDFMEGEKCMKALFLTDPSEDRDILKWKKGSRARGTCEWIFDTKKLNTWLHLEETEHKSPPNSVLWLHGNPGTGKSTMAIFLTEKLSTDFDAMENMTLAYFFCDANFQKQKTATSILRGLLYQLVQKHRHLLSKYIVQKYKERGDQLFTSFNALWAVFIAAATDQDTGRKYCIIDALDECDNDSKNILLHQLHETFHCQGEPPPNLFVLIISRPYPEIREYLQDFINSDLASFDEARRDIDRCIKERVDDLAKKKQYTDKVKREIIDLLREKAEGTFLWIGLACEELKEKPSKDAIRFVRNMPKGLTSVYRKLLKTAIEGETSECVTIRRILSFVAVSFEALSVLQLSEACQLHQDESDLETRLQYTRDQIASCRLLVVIHDKKVQLLHQSVRDFLTGFGSGFFVERLEAHTSAASCCIDNLVKRLHGEHTSEGPFLNYASKYWTEHIREAGEKFKIWEPQIPFFEAKSNSRSRWVQRDLFFPANDSFLRVAVRSSLPILVEYALGMREVHPIKGRSAFNIKNDPKESFFSPLEDIDWLRTKNNNEQAKIVNMLLKAGSIVTGRAIRKAIISRQVEQEVVLSLLDHMHPETRRNTIQELLLEDEEWLHRTTILEIKVMPIILAKYGNQITIDEKFIEDAALSSTGMEVVPLLLNQRRSQIAITGDIMARAATNKKLGSELVEFLLKYQGDQNLMTENMIVAAMNNKRHCKRIIQLLCQHQSGRITITTKILEYAVIQEQGREILELLLRHRGDQPAVTITDYMLNRGAENDGRAREILFFILQNFGNAINVADATMITTINRPSYNAEFIEFLIQGGAHIVITNEIVEATLDVNSPGYESRIACIKIFFKYRQKLEFTEQAWATIFKSGHHPLSEQGTQITGRLRERPRKNWRIEEHYS